MGLMSKQTAAEMLPVIEDAEQEKDRSTEALETALLASVQQKAAPARSPIDLAWLMQQVETEPARAPRGDGQARRARERAAGRRRSQPGTPEAQAGLATGTPAAAQAAQPTIPPGPESQANLTGILGALRLGQRLSPAERPPQVA
jgi:hypothetical protein